MPTLSRAERWPEPSDVERGRERAFGHPKWYAVYPLPPMPPPMHRSKSVVLPRRRLPRPATPPTKREAKERVELLLAAGLVADLEVELGTKTRHQVALSCELFRAAGEGDAPGVQSLLAQRADPLQRHRHGQLPLHVARTGPVVGELMRACPAAASVRSFLGQSAADAFVKRHAKEELLAMASPPALGMLLAPGLQGKSALGLLEPSVARAVLERAGGAFLPSASEACALLESQDLWALRRLWLRLPRGCEALCLRHLLFEAHDHDLAGSSRERCDRALADLQATLRKLLARLCEQAADDADDAEAEGVQDLAEGVMQVVASCPGQMPSVWSFTLHALNLAVQMNQLEPTAFSTFLGMLPWPQRGPASPSPFPASERNALAYLLLGRGDDDGAHLAGPASRKVWQICRHAATGVVYYAEVTATVALFSHRLPSSARAEGEKQVRQQTVSARIGGGFLYETLEYEVPASPASKLVEVPATSDAADMDLLRAVVELQASLDCSVAEELAQAVQSAGAKGLEPTRAARAWVHCTRLWQHAVKAEAEAQHRVRQLLCSAHEEAPVQIRCRRVESHKQAWEKALAVCSQVSPGEPGDALWDLLVTEVALPSALDLRKTHDSLLRLDWTLHGAEVLGTASSFDIADGGLKSFVAEPCLRDLMLLKTSGGPVKVELRLLLVNPRRMTALKLLRDVLMGKFQPPDQRPLWTKLLRLALALRSSQHEALKAALSRAREALRDPEFLAYAGQPFLCRLEELSKSLAQREEEERRLKEGAIALHERAALAEKCLERLASAVPGFNLYLPPRTWAEAEEHGEEGAATAATTATMLPEQATPAGSLLQHYLRKATCAAPAFKLDVASLAGARAARAQALHRNQFS